RESASQCLAHMLASGADPRATTLDDDYPGGHLTTIGAAAGYAGVAEWCERLAAAGATPSSEDLSFALAKQQWDAAEKLVSLGVSCNALDAGGCHAPLHWLADYDGKLEPIQWLLEGNADVNLAAGPLKETPLHTAVRRRRMPLVEPFVRAGADIDARTTGGVTAYQHALRRKFTEVCRELERLGASTEENDWDRLAVACQTGNIDEAKAILRAAPELPKGACFEDARLLPDLTGYSKLEAMTLLIDAGIDIEARGLDNGTSLHIAGWFGQPEAARLLIARGASLDPIGDDHHSTPLGWVAHGSRYSGGAEQNQDAYADVARQLLEAGAPLPGPKDTHDHPQLRQATPAVQAVLREFGWDG
ncbi:MAG: hypothetical protein RL885_10435, partial [Planctomycetota bacterium]